MALLTPEVIVSTLTLAGGLVTWAIERYSRRSKRITYRIRTNTPLKIDPEAAADQFQIYFDGVAVQDPSIVVVRVENAGGVDVTETDIQVPITFRFGERRLLGAALINTGPPEIERLIEDNGGLHISPQKDELVLPKFPMNRQNSLEMRIMLKGPGNTVSGGGFIAGGNVAPDNTPPALTSRRSTRTILFAAVNALLAGLLIAFIITSLSPKSTIDNCTLGALAVRGSTAFAPAATALGDSYRAICPSSSVAATGVGSNDALRELQQDGGRNDNLVVMADVDATSQYPEMVRTPVAVVPYTVTVNAKAGVTNLRIDQVRAIYSGSIKNWSKVGGADLEIKLVGRTRASGTRTTFESRVLGGTREPEVTSNSCDRRDVPNAKPEDALRCEVSDNKTMLENVNVVDGAIGYATTSGLAGYGNVRQVQLDGFGPSPDTIRSNRYPFWAVESFYTFGAPPPDTLAARFIGYISSPAGQNVIRRESMLPCSDYGALCR